MKCYIPVVESYIRRPDMAIRYSHTGYTVVFAHIPRQTTVIPALIQNTEHTDIVTNYTLYTLNTIM